LNTKPIPISGILEGGQLCVQHLIAADKVIGEGQEEDILIAEEIIACLLEGGANPDYYFSTTSNSPLFDACRFGLNDRAIALIAAGQV